MTSTVEISQSAFRARAIYERLMALPRDSKLSNNEWAKKAGVNTSFFTNLKKGSEPSVGNLREILQVVGVSLPEFFAHEAAGRLMPAPTREQLEAAIDAVLPGLPRNPDKRARYLAEAVADALVLPGIEHPNVVGVDFRKLAADRKAQQLLETKNSTESWLPHTG